MTSKQELQLLSDAVQTHADQTRNLQNAIRKLNGLKKDQEIKQQQHCVLQLLQTLNDELTDLQKRAVSAEKDLESALQSSGELKNDQEGSDSNNTHAKADTDKKRLPNPEDQETAYHVKARMMPQIHSQNKSLQAELILRNRRNDLRSRRQEKRTDHNKDTNLSTQTTLHIISMHERRARVAEARAEELQKQLDEKQGANRQKQATYSASDRSQSSAAPQSRINEIGKRNQQLIEENQDHQHEIQRLRRDNAELIKKAKHAEQERNQAMSQLSTSEMARRDLYTRFQRQKTQYDRLSRSLTRQSSDWIEAKKQQQQDEEEFRWRNVGHAALHGSSERTFSHPVPKNVDQPRNMYPVTQYAQPVV